MDGWNTSLSYWGPGLFSGAKMLVSGRVTVMFFYFVVGKYVLSDILWTMLFFNYMMPMNLQLSQCVFGGLIIIEMQKGLKFMSFLLITTGAKAYQFCITQVFCLLGVNVSTAIIVEQWEPQVCTCSTCLEAFTGSDTNVNRYNKHCWNKRTRNSLSLHFWLSVEMFQPERQWNLWMSSSGLGCWIGALFCTWVCGCVREHVF